MVLGQNPSLSRRAAWARGQRLVYDAQHSADLPGKLLRTEGDPPIGDPIVDKAYDAIGATLVFFDKAYGRSSIDNQNGKVSASVHYGTHYMNAFWNGAQLVIGDGDGELFTEFTNVDVIAAELGKAVIETEVGLYYWGQSGALIESIAAVFGCLAKQYNLRQTADQADWLLGAGLFGPRVKGVALRSLKAPGTAYDDPVLGTDAEVAHMREYVETSNDQGGIHTNSGIPGHAFYLLAAKIGGYAWERAGRIWYRTLTSGRLNPNSEFRDFADATVAVAEELYRDGPETEAVLDSWHTVGIAVAKCR